MNELDTILSSMDAQTFLLAATDLAQSRQSNQGPTPRNASSLDDCFPLSPAQWRLWTTEQIGTTVAAYYVPVAVRLRGRLDLVALERSFQETIMRHEVLRTTFELRNGVPQQIVRAAIDWR